jgi:hypothetical protein
VYTLTSLGDTGARGEPVSVRDDVAQPASIGSSTIAKIRCLAIPEKPPDYFGGGSLAAGGDAAGGTSAFVVRFVNRHPSLVLTRLSV